jgi:hypothetical protein
VNGDGVTCLGGVIGLLAHGLFAGGAFVVLTGVVGAGSAPLAAIGGAVGGGAALLAAIGGTDCAALPGAICCTAARVALGGAASGGTGDGGAAFGGVVFGGGGAPRVGI